MNPSAAIFVSSLLCGLAVFWGLLSAGAVWDRFVRGYLGDITPKLLALGMDQAGVNSYLRWWGVAIFATFVLFGVILAMPPVALGLAYLVFVAPRYLLNYQIEKRRLRLRDQLVRAATALANSARAGLSLPQAMEAVAGETPEPLGRELRRIVRDYQAGRPYSDVLKETKERLDIEAFTIFCSAILVCMERGGKITYALERISQGLLEFQRLERKLEADTASGRKLATVLSIFPLIFMAGFTLLDPVSMGYLYNTFLGQCVLVLVGAMVYLSALWCMKILQIDF